MKPLDYSTRLEIENNAFLATKKMVKIDTINRHKPDFRKWGRYVYDVLEPEFKKIKKLTFIKEYSPWVDSVAGVGFINDVYSLDPRESCFPIEFSSRVPWPGSFCINGLAGTGNYGHLVLYDNPIWYDLRDELAAYNAVVKSCTESRCVFFYGVKKICAHYDTINEALAAWPALRFLLPENLQTRDLPFDGTPKALPDGVDIAELTAAVVRAKLTEA